MARRIAVVDKEKCNPGKCQLECIKFNPHNRAGIEVIKIVDGKAWIDEKLSTDADQISAKKCPFQAIHMVKLPEALDQEPIHRFGDNGFALYNVPIPKFGSVVGIIGKNGIGKSTALNLLAGREIPNLSTGNKDYEGVIQRLKGTEAQNYFQKLNNKEIITAFKPQQVELIPKKFSGTVKELLSKADEKKELNKIVKVLALEKFLDRDISKLSGGELQRVAIALCLSQEADLYLLDEPSAYLDVEQRLSLSRMINDVMHIRGSSALIVDHDMLFLDYITNRILVFDGEPAISGESKGPFDKNTGMNEFLKDLEITFRRDPDSKRPRANKEGSQLDTEQKSKKKYYYAN